MSEMIERVARAIGKVEGYDLPNDLTLPHTSGSRVGRTLAMARAAIEEMRESTPEMHKAAWEACDRVNEFVAMNDKWADYNGRVYRAMISAALNEQVSG